MRRRTADYCSACIISVAIIVTLAGMSSCWQTVSAAQSQDAINALNNERITELTRRIGDLESAIRWGIMALLAQLSAHALQVWSALFRRGEHR